MPSVSFHSELPSFSIKEKNRIKKWLHAVAVKHGGSINAIQYVFCDDAYLLGINKEYLNHDTLTDIVTFRYSEHPQPLESDIYISVERVKENAADFSASFENELRRVMVHGVLHLLGFKDKTAKDKELMRKEEDVCLEMFSLAETQRRKR